MNFWSSAHLWNSICVQITYLRWLFCVNKAQIFWDNLIFPFIFFFCYCCWCDFTAHVLQVTTFSFLFTHGKIIKAKHGINLKWEAPYLWHRTAWFVNTVNTINFVLEALNYISTSVLEWLRCTGKTNIWTSHKHT